MKSATGISITYKDGGQFLFAVCTVRGGIWTRVCETMHITYSRH